MPCLALQMLSQFADARGAWQAEDGSKLFPSAFAMRRCHKGKLRLMQSIVILRSQQCNDTQRFSSYIEEDN